MPGVAQPNEIGPGSKLIAQTGLPAFVLSTQSPCPGSPDATAGPRQRPQRPSSCREERRTEYDAGYCSCGPDACPSGVGEPALRRYLGAVRFVIAVEVLVEAESVDELDAVADQLEIAAAASARDRLSRHPADSSSSSLCITALDDESLATLVRADHWAAGNGVRVADAESPVACQLPQEPDHGDDR